MDGKWEFVTVEVRECFWNWWVLGFGRRKDVFSSFDNQGCSVSRKLLTFAYFENEGADKDRSGYNIPKMADDLTSLPLTESIPIPPIPTTFFPGATPASTLLGTR
jgi:rhamnogalacturonan hydrolase